MLRMLTYPKHSVTSVCFNADGNKLVSGSYDKTLKVWSVGSSGTFECESTLRVDGQVSSLDFSPCGSKIAAAFNVFDDDYDFESGGVKIFGMVGSTGTFECESTLAGHTR